ncbi:tumor necrosis factor receptor superfamily member 5 isoform X2 [Erinaceus europaeus]|uniref:Tumor necrosis factor receptor superfamily member 5 n=1 Tax=Erinaceus europaeus TaxID=9365 RepID=A0ABM3XDK8_ERIEU|nr:tumor necrosis factor receptor superfamily member 5 isoform X2 [Erinaceus europaeus]
MVRLPLQCLVWGCLLTAVYPESSTTCRENKYYKNGQCCDLCPPGKKLVKDCIENSQTECISCNDDEFLPSWNAETRCHQHKYCDHNLGLRVQKKGTLKSDTICMCDEGQHCTSEACERCILHSLCSPGYGVKQIGISDTKCEPCPFGFFSNVSSSSEKCRPWTSCETKGLEEQQPGTNMTDAVCGFRPRMRALVVIPITIGLLFAVVLLSFCIRKVASNKEPVVEVLPMKHPVETEDLPPVQETLHGYQPVTQEDGKESRISVQERL